MAAQGSLPIFSTVTLKDSPKKSIFAQKATDGLFLRLRWNLGLFLHLRWIFLRWKRAFSGGLCSFYSTVTKEIAGVGFPSLARNGITFHCNLGKSPRARALARTFVVSNASSTLVSATSPQLAAGGLINRLLILVAFTWYMILASRLLLRERGAESVPR